MSRLKPNSTARMLMFAKGFPPTRGGLETYSFDLAVAFHQAGVRPLVITALDGPRGLRRYCGLVVLNVGMGPQAFVFLRMLWSAFRVRRRRPFRFTYATTWRVGLPAIFARTTRPLYVTIHGREILMPRGVMRRLMRWVFRRIDHVFSVSHFTLNEARRSKLIAPGEGTANWNGCRFPEELSFDESVVTDASKQTNVSTVKLRGDRALVMLTLCRLVERKNVQGIIIALGRLKRAGRLGNVKYKVAGDGEMRVRIAELVQAENLKDNVELLGRVSDREKNALYRQADLFLHPQISLNAGKDVEGFGLVVAEAMAHQIPVLVGKAGGTADFVTDYESGRVVDGNNLTELTDALEELIQGPELRMRLGNSGGRWVRTHLSWENHAERILRTLYGEGSE